MYPGRHAQTDPDRAALVMAGSGRVVTYRELEDRSNRLAQLMWDAGLRRGDHIAVFLENHPVFLEVYWAAIRSGLYLTPVNRQLTAEEAAYIIGDCRARLLVTSAQLGDVAEALVPAIPDCPLRLMVDGVRDGYASYEAAVAEHPAEPLAHQPIGDLLLYSSGTTGSPKGIWRPLPDTTLDESSPRLARSGLLEAADDLVYLSPGPLYHAAVIGFAVTVQRLGGTVVVMERFDALEALRAIEAHRVTTSQWVPTMFTRMLRLPEEDRLRYDLSSHRMALHGAAPCPVRTKREMIEWWGPIVTEFYGASEGNGLTVIDAETWLSHVGSVGRAAVGTLHVCDDAGNALPPGEDGLVYFERSHQAFAYLGDDAKTSSAQHPAHPTWTTLGDIGHLDDEGYLYLTDRTSFVIISGGVNIYPAESENLLLGHPAVAEVAVIGVPNAEFGEEVKAVVQATDGSLGSPELERELIGFCREHLAHYKCPRSVDFVAHIPRLESGKLAKRTISAPYWADATATGRVG